MNDEHQGTNDRRRPDEALSHEQEMRHERLDDTIKEMQKDISRIDKATAVLTHSIDGDGVPGLADNIKGVVLEMASVKADLILRIEAVRADFKVELAPLKISVGAITAAPGIKAMSTISRVLWIVVPIVISGILALIVLGLISWIQSIRHTIVQ